MSETPASWQPDPTGQHDHRYWDGTEWTDNVADAGVASTDAYEPVPDSVVSPDAPTVVTPVPSDDTATYPTAMAPPYPAPPPYVPPAFAPPPPVPTGGAARGGSRRSLVIGGAILAVVGLAVVALLALGGDDDPTGPLADGSSPTTAPGDERTDTTEPTETDGDLGPTDAFSDEDLEDVEDILDQVYEGMGLSEEQVECLDEHITESLGSGDVEDEAGMRALFGLLADCDISIEDLTGGFES